LELNRKFEAAAIPIGLPSHQS